jgi:hypothetical protein
MSPTSRHVREVPAPIIRYAMWFVSNAFYLFQTNVGRYTGCGLGAPGGGGAQYVVRGLN